MLSEQELIDARNPEPAQRSYCDTARWILAGTVLLMTLCCIATLFWYMDWVYSLPTPVPASYQPVPPGTPIDMTVLPSEGTGKPIFLHFFNPHCPCSRFNIPEFKALVQKYGERISFSVVVMLPEGDGSYTEEDIQDELGSRVPISFDRAIAKACGVYSTPQAVLMDAHGRLFYRGNYNKSRYCTAPATRYARMAIDSLLNGSGGVAPGLAAVTSYGCELPGCKNE